MRTKTQWRLRRKEKTEIFSCLAWVFLNTFSFVSLSFSCIGRDVNMQSSRQRDSVLFFTIEYTLSSRRDVMKMLIMVI
jgi:hypothetical protein